MKLKELDRSIKAVEKRLNGLIQKPGEDLVTAQLWRFTGYPSQEAMHEDIIKNTKSFLAKLYHEKPSTAQLSSLSLFQEDPDEIDVGWVDEIHWRGTERSYDIHPCMRVRPRNNNGQVSNDYFTEFTIYADTPGYDSVLITSELCEIDFLDSSGSSEYKRLRKRDKRVPLKTLEYGSSVLGLQGLFGFYCNFQIENLSYLASYSKLKDSIYDYGYELSIPGQETFREFILRTLHFDIEELKSNGIGSGEAVEQFPKHYISEANLKHIVIDKDIVTNSGVNKTLFENVNIERLDLYLSTDLLKFNPGTLLEDCNINEVHIYLENDITETHLRECNPQFCSCRTNNVVYYQELTGWLLNYWRELEQKRKYKAILEVWKECN